MADVFQGIEILESEIVFQFVRSRGAGGQNVNKLNTKAVLFFNVEESSKLPREVKLRFLEKWKSRISEEGEVVIASDRFRSQNQNIEDALSKLEQMIQTVFVPPKKRKKTKKTKGSIERRLKEKKLRSQNKTHRSKVEY